MLLEADVSFDLTREFLERVQARAVGTEAPQGGPARPAARQDRLRRAGGAARREAGAARVRLGAADGHPAGRPAGLGQDDDGRQAGPAAQGWSRRRRSWWPPTSTVRPPWISWSRVAGQAGVGVHAEPGVTDVVGIVRRGIEAAGKARARTVLVDTAGRLQIDDEMMDGAGAAQGRGQAARDPAGGRRHDRAGRGADRERLPRGARHHRRDPDQDGRRRPRRRGPVDLRRDEGADQVRRHRARSSTRSSRSSRSGWRAGSSSRATC